MWVQVSVNTKKISIYRLLPILIFMVSLDASDTDLDGFEESMLTSSSMEKVKLMKRELEDMLVVVESWVISEKIKRDPLMRDAVEALDNMKFEATMLLTTNDGVNYATVKERYGLVMERYIEMRTLFNTNDEEGEEDAPTRGEEDEACMTP